MKSSEHWIKAPDGRRIAVWHDRPEEERHRPILIANGFARRMSEMSSLAAYALANGAPVYRFDALDHVGLSDGVILNYTLTTMQQSLDATLGFIAGAEGGRPVSLIAISLSAVPAILSAADSSMVASLACLVGVVDARRTYERVLGADYLSWPYQEVPETVQFERHDVDPRGFWREHDRTRVADAGLLQAALTRLRAPILNMVGLEDEWVTLEEVRRAFTAPGGGKREIVELTHGGHEIARNPVALRIVMRHIIAWTLYGKNVETVREPNFDEIADFRVADRERARAHATKGEDAGARTGL